MQNTSDDGVVIRPVETSNLQRRPNKLEGVSITRAKGVSMSLADNPAHGEPLILDDGIAIDSSELESGLWL